MNIIDINDFSRLTELNEAETCLLAGHMEEIVGVVYGANEAKRDCSKQLPYKGKAILENRDKIQTIWINHKNHANSNFSIKIENNEVKAFFIQKYASIISKEKNFFIVLNNTIYKSHSDNYDHKRFSPIDNVETFDNTLKIWPVD